MRKQKKRPNATLRAAAVKPITSLSDYLLALREVKAEFQDNTANFDRLWFRGIQDGRLPLLPGGYWRDDVDETHLLTEFKCHAPVYIRGETSSFGSIGRDDPWEWYFLMQHYGLPTRLLDWSESPLVALFFALLEPKQRRTPAVWILNPHQLNQVSTRDPAIVFPGGPFSDHWLPIETEHQTTGCAPGKARSFTYNNVSYTNDLPIAIFPVRRNARIIAQLGVFTIHGCTNTSLATVSSETDTSRFLTKLDIDPRARTSLLKDIQLMGIHELVLFPELPKLAQYIKSQLGITP